MWDCVKEAERLSGADHAKFLRFEAQMKQEDWKANPDDVKRMEVLFLTFSNYAQLRYLSSVFISIITMFSLFKGQVWNLSVWILPILPQ